MDNALPPNIDRLCALEQVAASRFRSQPLEPQRLMLFGGQTMAQGLVAASRTVGPGRQVHSLHAYFLRSGDPTVAVDYVVVDLREGRSFSTRRVEAVQGNRVIFEMLVSFQPPESGLEHQWTIPAGVPAPETVTPDPSTQDRPPHYQLMDIVEMRTVGGRDRVGEPWPPERASNLTWSRVYGPLPSEHVIHAALLAYISDMTLLITASKTQGISLQTESLQTASLDHAIWFHRDFHIDDWLLHEVFSPSLSSSRALCASRVFTEAGVLVATVAQEGMVRQVVPV